MLVAGIVYCKELLDLTEKQIEQTFKVNTLAPIWTLREFLPHMMDTNHGHVVTIASTVGECLLKIVTYDLDRLFGSTTCGH